MVPPKCEIIIVLFYCSFFIIYFIAFHKVTDIDLFLGIIFLLLFFISPSVVITPQTIAIIVAFLDLRDNSKPNLLPFAITFKSKKE